MEYSFSQLSNIAKSLRERYPIGTRIKLISMGDDPRPIPPGTKGTVEGIDDIATVFCRFDNGRSLGLAYGEDQYRALTQRELLEEKCARNYDKFYEAVHRDIFADVDLDRFAEEIENANDNYTTEILRQLHDKFVEIYDTDSVDGLVGFIQVPAIVEAIQIDKIGFGSIDFNKIIPEPYFPSDQDCIDWRRKHWDTKWEAYGYRDGIQYDENKQQIRFRTVQTIRSSAGVRVAQHPLLRTMQVAVSQPTQTPRYMRSGSTILRLTRYRITPMAVQAHPAHRQRPTV